MQDFLIDDDDDYDNNNNVESLVDSLLPFHSHFCVFVCVCLCCLYKSMREPPRLVVVAATAVVVVVVCVSSVW